MTSVSSPPPPPHTSGPSSRNFDWSGSGSRGSVHRGTGRGRGRGRGGPPRGGGGHRRGGVSGTRHDQPTTTSSTSEKAPPAPAPITKATPKVESKPAGPGDQSATNKSVSASIVSKPTAPSNPKPNSTAEPPTRSRSNNRRSSTAASKAPAPQAVPSKSSAESLRSPTTSSGSSARTQNRRRRTKAPPSSTPAPKPGPVKDDTTPTSTSRLAQTSPAPPESTKDAPPHFTVKPNGAIKRPADTLRVDSLVEHVRSMAMDRPTTPGTASHIDWAGDDDDTLPDLDDWGVTSATTTSDDSQSTLAEKLMSPILDDSIKQLPLHGKSPGIVHPTLPLSAPNPFEGEQIVPMEGIPEVTVIEPVTVEIPSVQTVTPIAKQTSGSATKPNTRSNGPRPIGHMVHPLPAKPTTVTPAKSFRNHVSPPFTALPLSNDMNEPANPAPIAELEAKPSPMGNEIQIAKLPSTNRQLRAPGLEASIHAPHNSKSDSGLPPTPQTAPPFNPSHGRSRTLGRPVFSGDSGFAGRQVQSGTVTPTATAISAHHGRTQSTPPSAAGMARHARHASRPVITGDAISRLARTLGSTAPRKEPTGTAATVTTSTTSPAITTSAV